MKIQPLRALLILFCVVWLMPGCAHAAEFSVPFKPLKHDVLAVEALWQGANIVDLQQTLRISREPERFREVGTLGVFCGNHPSSGQVLAVSLLAGAAHYAVTQALTNAGWDTAARIWSYASLGIKTGDIRRNQRIGLGY